MITRIVKLSFDPEKVNQFLKIFDDSKQKIKKMNGCISLELLNDINTPNVFFTYSKWNSEQDLNYYRNSELFKNIWANTKILFNDKPNAWSVSTLESMH